MFKSRKTGKILTVRVHHENLDPRTFRIPSAWITQAAWLAWGLLLITLLSSTYALREYLSERSARPELVSELENEVQNLKIALEKKGGLPENPNLSASATPVDSKAVTEKPAGANGSPLSGRDGVWSGLADQIKLPAPGQPSPIGIEDAKLEWQGKYAMFSANVAYRDPGKGSQQGHLVILGRGNGRVLAHPDGVLNTSSGSALFDPGRGEYFSVSHFRVLKAGLGPFDSPEQLKEIQVFAFDLNNRLLLFQTYKYGK
ncbi:MAG: hypothetical protein EBX52_00085 [Proteobacteria bacterium]|nr:hypothetical protein [Pseudomonadota bacterium]